MIPHKPQIKHHAIFTDADQFGAFYSTPRITVFTYDPQVLAFLPDDGRLAHYIHC